MWNQSQLNEINLGTTRFIPDPPTFLDNILYFIAFIYLKGSSYTNKPSGFGFCIWVKKDYFEKVNGFDESLSMEEDNHFTEKVSKLTRLKFFKNVYIHLSSRRFANEGYVKTMFKYINARISYLTGKNSSS